MISIGDNQVVELEAERVWSVRDGWKTTRRFRGTKEAVNAFVPTLLIDGSNIRIIPDEGPLAVVEVSYANAQDGASVSEEAQIITTWSVQSNELEQSIIESDYFDDLPGGAGVDGDTERVLIKNFLDGNGTREQHIDLVSSPQAKAMVEMIAQGKTAFAISQIVLRRTRVISAFDSAYTFLASANKVYSRAQLIAAFAPPAAVQSEMPAGGEWLARNGTKQQQSNGKWSLEQEWWHGDRISPIYERIT